MLDAGKPVYVGWSKDVPGRIHQHWKHRNHKARSKENPRFNEWLRTLLFSPDYKILAVVPYEQRYAEERKYTLVLAAKHELFNIAYGPAPLHRPSLTEAHKAKISASVKARYAGDPEYRRVVAASLEKARNARFRANRHNITVSAIDPRCSVTAAPGRPDN